MDLSEIITHDDWAEIIGVAVTQARNGDAQARKWLSDSFSATMPKPAPNRPKCADPMEEVLRKWIESDEFASSFVGRTP